MPKIPDYTNFGARPSLRTTRLDMPGDAANIQVDSLNRAVEQFSRVMVDAKQKNDRVNYSRVKTELLTEDIRIRRELEEEGNWRNYDEDYRERIAEVRQRLSPQISDPTDKTIFDADANLLVERGSTAMLDKRQKRLIDYELGELGNRLSQFRYDVLDADPWTRREILREANEAVDAVVEAGYLAADVGQAQKQKFVQDVSRAELIAMDPRERVIFLDRAIEGNVDPSDFSPGSGTGSLADFLPQDVRIEMKRQAEQEIESKDTLNEAQALADRADELFQADTADNAAARLKYIRENSSGEVRQEAMSIARRSQADRERVKSMRQGEVVSSWTDRFMEGKPAFKTDPETGEQVPDPAANGYWSTADIPRDEWNLLGAGQKQALQQLAIARQQNRSFSLATEMVKRTDSEGTEMPSYSLWRRMTDEQKVGVDLDSAEWLMAFNEQDWRNLKTHQDELKDGRGMTYADGLTNDQMLLSALIKTEWTPARDRKPEEDRIYARARLEFDRRIQEEMRRQGVSKLSNPERRKILGEMLISEGYTDETWGLVKVPTSLFPVPGRVPDEESRMPLSLMSEEQVNAAYIPISQASDANDPAQSIKIGDNRLSIAEALRQHAMNPRNPTSPDITPGLGLTEPPKRRDLERAIFAYKAKLGQEEINRRLMGQ